MCGDIEQCFAVAPASDFAVRAAKQMPAAVAMAIVASIGETARVCKKNSDRLGDGLRPECRRVDLRLDAARPRPGSCCGACTFVGSRWHGVAWHDTAVRFMPFAIYHYTGVSANCNVYLYIYIAVGTNPHMSSCFFSFAVGTKPGKRHPQCQLQCRGPPSVPPGGRGPRWARLCPVLGHCWREGEETIPRACFFLPPVVPLWPLGGVPLRPAVAGRLAAKDK